MNCKVNRYYSYNLELEAVGIDAFSYCWSNETFYAFPPFAIISKVLSKLEAEVATGVLIACPFTTQSCFTRLLRLLIHGSLLLPKYLYFPCRRKIMPALTNVALIARLVSGSCTKTETFQMKGNAETIIESWRPNTKCKYDTCRRQWLQFYSQRMCDPMCTTLVTVLEFLNILQKRKLGYSVLNSARVMISLLPAIEGYDAGKHPLACWYMKGVCNSNPSLPKRSFTWDEGAVVRYLSSISQKSLLNISRKLASLLAILCGQRRREILSVMSIRNTTIKEDFLLIRIGDQLKITGINFHEGEMKFPVFENANICPMKLFK